MIAAGKTKACQPAKFFRITGYRELRAEACGVSMSSLGRRHENKCDKVLCETMARASKGLRGNRLRRLHILSWWIRYVLLGWHSKPCGTYAKRMSGTTNILDKRYRAHHSTCGRQLIDGSRSFAINVGGRRYGSWKDFLFKERRVKCSSRKRVNGYGVTPRCIKPLRPLAKIKALLQKKYGGITYEEVTKGPVYNLTVIIHRMINKRNRDAGRRILEVDGHTGKVIKVSLPERYLNFDD